MMNSHFDLAVAGRTQRNKVVKFVGDVNDQVVSTCVDVVDVKCSPVGIAINAAQTANLISLQNDAPYLLPARAVLQPRPAFVIRVTLTNHMILGARIRTEPTAPLKLTSECPVFLAAMIAPYQRGRDKPGILASCRAIASGWFFRVERCAAVLTNGYASRRNTPGAEALGGTKSMVGALLYNVVWPLKRYSAAGTGVRLRLHLRGVLAGLAAIDGFSVVGFELRPALGAQLEHR